MAERVSTRRVAIVALYVGCVVLALIASAVLIAVTGGPWRRVLGAMLDGSLRKPGRWGVTIKESVPLLVVALGAIVTSRAGLVNIGQEGQLAIGAAGATWVGIHQSGPLAIVIALLAGCLAGAMWAGLAAVLRFWRGVPEVISTLLLVFVAAQLIGYLLNRKSLLLDDGVGTAERLQTSKMLDAATRLGVIRIAGNAVPWIAVVAVLAAAATGVVLARTRWGFHLTVLGRNPRAAQRIGVPVVAAGATALLIGGALAGAAGATMLLTGSGGYRLTPGFSNNVGWSGLLVALVARNRPLACIPVAFIFGMLSTGSAFLSSTGVERSVSEVVRALLVLAMLVPAALVALWDRRTASALEGADPEPREPATAGARR